MAHENTVSVEFHREMVEAAFREGWEEGFYDIENDSWVDDYWDNSDAKAALPKQGDEDHGKG